MESVTTYCSQCDHPLATLLNLWVQIGKSYISPVTQAENGFVDILPLGPARRGEKGTIVDSCRVKEVVCTICGSTLGSICESAAVNHVLYEGQLLLRTLSITIKDPDSNDVKRPFIQRVLELRNPPVDKVQNSENNSEDGNRSPSSAEDHSYGQTGQDTPSLSRILSDIHAQRGDIERLDKAGFEIVASFNNAMQRIDEDVRRLKREMGQVVDDSSDNTTKTKGLVKDVLAIESEVNDMKEALHSSVPEDRLEQEILAIKKVISKTSESLRLEFTETSKTYQQKVGALESNLDSARRDVKEMKVLLEDSWVMVKTVVSAANDSAEEIAALKTELQRVKEELALERSRKSHPVNPAFVSRDMDILTSNITKIGNRASQVEPLRMEFDLLKGRVQRMETQFHAPETHATPDTPDTQRTEPPRSRSVGLKRKASSMSARPVLPSDVEDDLGHSGGALSPPPSEESSIRATNIAPVRLTKSGITNMQTLTPKRGSRQGITGSKTER
ncbi:hypothetical protein GGR50DRAFT_190040 [Xylaria sp. CBS 124048]|nr:hypothetical protein GGR50DRAFT_190040 [Xylaria sp. CBS 124048]